MISGYTEDSMAEEKDDNESATYGNHQFSIAVGSTFVALLKACAQKKDLCEGTRVHADILKRGLLEKNPYVASSLVSMYAKCGALAKAWQVLDKISVRDVISWTALTAGYAQQGLGKEAMNCFTQMQGEGLSPNAITFTCILKVCSSMRAADKGKQIHNRIVNQGLLGKDIVLGTALVDMYVKCSVLSEAQQVLDRLPFRNVVSWNALINGYVQHDQSEEALTCFERMQSEGLFPDAFTFSFILKACGSLGAADKGKLIQDELIGQGLLGKTVVLGNALVDMYSKCGALAKAHQVLDELPVRNVVSWSALMAGYSQWEQGEEALTCFEQMQREGLSPDAITFTCVLNACSRSGLVTEGQIYLASMSRKFGITPVMEHYTCMIDLFGRAGHFDKALAVIKKLPSFDDRAVWSALLAACHKWGNVELGKWAFDCALQVDENGSAAYVCMANIYAAAGMQESAGQIEVMRLRNALLANMCML